MRCAILTLWASLAVALSAAVCGDAATEWLSNEGFWGVGTRDVHHESLLPVALVAAIVTAALAAFVLAAHLRCGDPLLRIRRRACARVWLVGLTALLTMLVVVLMEGYEVRFGGISAFDPRSVVITHALPVLCAYALIGILVDRMLVACLRVACRAVGVVAAALVAFARRGAAAQACIRTGPQRTAPVERRPERIRPACELRAPPIRECFSLTLNVRRLTWRLSGGS